MPFRGGSGIVPRPTSTRPSFRKPACFIPGRICRKALPPRPRSPIFAPTGWIAASPDWRGGRAEYTRYADDLAFSGGEEFERGVERFSTHVAAILLEEGFTVNHRKTRIMRQGVRQRLAGLVANEGPNVARADFDRLKATLTIAFATVRRVRTGRRILDFERIWRAGSDGWSPSIR